MKKIITIAMILMFLPLQSLYSEIMRFEIIGANYADKFENLNPEKWIWLQAGSGCRVDFHISNKKIYRIVFYAPGTSNSSDKYATFEVTDYDAIDNTVLFWGTVNNTPTKIKFSKIEEKSDGNSYGLISVEDKEQISFYLIKFIGMY